MKKLTDFDQDISTAMRAGYDLHRKGVGFQRKTLNQTSSNEAAKLLEGFAIGEPQVRIYINIPLTAKEQIAVQQAGDWLMEFIRNNRGIK